VLRIIPRTQEATTALWSLPQAKATKGSASAMGLAERMSQHAVKGVPGKAPTSGVMPPQYGKPDMQALQDGFRLLLIQLAKQRAENPIEKRPKERCL
jgi:hypothetical protein